jgi:hypothetical protein
MNISWTKKRLVIAALTTSLSGVGVASAETFGNRASTDSNRDQYGQRDVRDRSDTREGVKVENVHWGRDYKRDKRDERRHRRWHKRQERKHKKFEKRKDNRRGRDHGRRYGRY